MDDDDNGRYRTESIKFPGPFSFVQNFTWNLYPAWQHDSTLRRIRLPSPFLDLSRAKGVVSFSILTSHVCPVRGSSRSICAQYRILSLLRRFSPLYVDFFSSSPRCVAHSRVRNELEPKLREGRRDEKGLERGNRTANGARRRVKDEKEKSKKEGQRNDGREGGERRKTRRKGVERGKKREKNA